MNDKRQKRCFLISEDFISCGNCQINYSGKNPKKRIFCQEFSFPIQPENEKENNKRALKCKYWIPNNIKRDKVHVDAPEHKRWYEKDSIA